MEGIGDENECETALYKEGMWTIEIEIYGVILDRGVCRAVLWDTRILK